MSNLMDFLGNGKEFASVLNPPTPINKKIGAQLTVAGNCLPTPQNDGDFFELPVNSQGVLQRLSASGAVVWQWYPYNLTGDSLSYWTGLFWLDAVDSAIWVWCINANVSPYDYHLSKLDLATGAPTHPGTCQLSHNFSAGFNGYYFTRAAMGSGDFTIRNEEKEVIVSSSDGSLVQDVVYKTQNGITYPNSAGYETADGQIIIQGGPYDNDTSVVISIMRGGIMGLLTIPKFCPHNTSSAWVILWGDCVAIVNAAGARPSNGMFFNRAEFDAWLHRIADYYNLP